MDYLNIPRHLIYKQREDLKDFGVQIPGTMNHQLFSNLKEIFRATDRAKELILRCFNNAYYICTLIPFEDFPETQVAEYEKLLLKWNLYADEEVCAVTMAMVCKLLPACNAKWRTENNDLINSIRYRFTHFQWMHIGASTSFRIMYSNDNTDRLRISQNEFAPRDIIEAIENVSEYNLAVGAEYVCERLALLDDPKKRTYGADLAIARMKASIEEMGDIRQLGSPERSNVNTLWNGIDYIESHYPAKKNDSTEQTNDSPRTQEAEGEIVSTLTHQVDELQQQLAEKNKALQEAQQIIEEFRQPVEELTAKQKVRMEFAVQLLLKAGLKRENLDKKNRNKSKVAKLMSLLLDIRPTICANFLIDRNYYPQESDRNTILELDKLCLELGIIAHLSTQQQGNKKG